ncbi:hypothetical protein LTR70_006992 [Exophiala xenobiotica]|nr:hypothetical protein LTR70_006992 [Exophiala xenobiotica]
MTQLLQVLTGCIFFKHIHIRAKLPKPSSGIHRSRGRVVVHAAAAARPSVKLPVLALTDVEDCQRYIDSGSKNFQVEINHIQHTVLAEKSPRKSGQHAIDVIEMYWRNLLIKDLGHDLDTNTFLASLAKFWARV